MGLEVKRFDAPDEEREMPLGRFELVTIGGTTIGRASYESGWKWSEHVGAALAQRSCLVEHVGLVVSGRNRETSSASRPGTTVRSWAMSPTYRSTCSAQAATLAEVVCRFR